jgi:integrase
MARQINRLSARAVDTLRDPGRHADGGGLYLVVEPSGAKRWSFLFRQNGRLREMGLGGKSSVPLAMARDLAAGCRKVIATGGDPIANRRHVVASVPTFGAFADRFLEAKAPGWRNAKHRAQWAMTLTKYAAPLRSRPVDAILTEHVLAVLKSLWIQKPETASRLRGRIEQVLDAARAAGHRSGENPARWKGHLDQLLPKPKKLSRGHHKAMLYGPVPSFVAKLVDRPGVASRALEFLILTATRTSETLGARWSEINLENRTWTVPMERMKAGREHRVPLCDRALQILTEAKDFGSNDFVFPGQRPKRPLSGMSMEMLLRRMKVEDVTVHGFRSSFRDWAGDATSFPRELAEAALAHVVGDETEQAYRRSDALQKRRKLMDAWARFCGMSSATIIQLRSGAA